MQGFIARWEALGRPGQSKALLLGVLSWCLAVSVARAIRSPNNFVEGHWLVDYRFGFVKRGLVGTICNSIAAVFGGQMTPFIILVLSAILFTLFAGAVLYVLWRILRPAPFSPHAVLLALVVVTSPFPVLYSHTFGAFDAGLYAASVLAIGLTLANRPLVAGAVSVAAILSHEIYFLTGYPLTVLASLLVCHRLGGQGPWKAHAAGITSGLLTFGVIVLVHSLFIDPMALRAQLEEFLGSYPFIEALGLSVATFQTTGFFEYFRGQWPEFFPRILNPRYLLALGPSLLTMLVFLHVRYRVPPFRWLSWAIIGVVLAPLAMHSVAWDTIRISTFTLGSALLAAWVLSETRHERAAVRGFPLVAAPALMLNVLLPVPLMEDVVERFDAVTRVALYSPALLVAAGLWAFPRKGDTSAPSPGSNPVKIAVDKSPPPC